VLVVRLDSLGDLLICGPAIRAVAAEADRVTVLAGPAGAAAARLLPGVDDVLVWISPWIVADPPAVQPADVADLVARLAAAAIDEALILTSFHQSALPTALLLRLAGVGRITAISDDYPGSLLDVRVPSPPDAPEPERMLAVAQAAGYRLPAGDHGGLAVREGPTDVVVPGQPYVVVHPGVTAPARAYPPAAWAEVVQRLAADGWPVLVTGAADEQALTASVAGAVAIDRGGACTLPELAATLRRAVVVVAANTGPAHLAAAVGTPVVSLFAPVVPAVRWAPYTPDRRVLGDQAAACRDSRAKICPIEGHPCLTSVTPAEVVQAVRELAGAVMAGPEDRLGVRR
jgi:ADP-heptose:LPS heptosyltransferase